MENNKTLFERVKDRLTNDEKYQLLSVCLKEMIAHSAPSMLFDTKTGVMKVIDGVNAYDIKRLQECIKVYLEVVYEKELNESLL